MAGGDVDISGTWTNELKSMVTFEQNGHTLTGMYHSLVSEYPLKYNSFPLNGNIGTGSSTSLGFAVTYQGEEKDETSTSAWSGQYRNEDGKIYATWTLTSTADKKEDMWSSTQVGQDVFQRTYTDVNGDATN